MPDPITPQERKAIDDAIAAGKVEVCPPRTYAIDSLTGENRITGKSNRWGNNRQTPDLKLRRDKLLQLADGKRSAKAIAAALNITTKNLDNDIRYLRLRGHAVPMPSGGNNTPKTEEAR